MSPIKGGWKVKHPAFWDAAYWPRQQVTSTKPPPPTRFVKGGPASGKSPKSTRSRNKNPENCRLYEEWNPVRKTPQRILLFCTFGGPPWRKSSGGLKYEIGAHTHTHTHTSERTRFGQYAICTTTQFSFEYITHPHNLNVYMQPKVPVVR
jgi:hypothetical protein